MAILKNNRSNIQDRLTDGQAAAEFVNDNKRAVNEAIEVINSLGSASLRDESYFAKASEAVRLINLALVATTGNYHDLSNKPDLGALAQLELYADLASFPATGLTNKIYVANDTGHLYRWSGSNYIKVSSDTAIWGSIGGILTNQTDLKDALALKANVVDLFSGVYGDLIGKPTLGTASEKDAVNTFNSPSVDDDLPNVRAVIDYVTSQGVGVSYTEGSNIDLTGGVISVVGLGAAAFSDTSNFATAAQGSLASTALQSGDASLVATTGEFTDLLNIPDIAYLDEDGFVKVANLPPANLSNSDTDDLVEGISNLYFTDQRARDAVSTEGYVKADTLGTMASRDAVDFVESTGLHNSKITLRVSNAEIGSFRLNQATDASFNIDATDLAVTFADNSTAYTGVVDNEAISPSTLWYVLNNLEYVGGGSA